MLRGLTLEIGFVLTLPLFAVAGVPCLVLTIMAGIRTNEGKTYRYPVTIRIIK